MQNTNKKLRIRNFELYHTKRNGSKANEPPTFGPKVAKQNRFPVRIKI